MIRKLLRKENIILDAPSFNKSCLKLTNNKREDPTKPNDHNFGNDFVGKITQTNRPKINEREGIGDLRNKNYRTASKGLRHRGTSPKIPNSLDNININISQQIVKNMPENPSGPRVLSWPRENTALLTSLEEGSLPSILLSLLDDVEYYSKYYWRNQEDCPQ